MNLFSQTRSNDRQPVAAGRFYSDRKESLTADLKELFDDSNRTVINKSIRAVIVPHAGYVFSGRTAAAAYSSIAADAEFSNIFIIGSSHIMSFDGASVYFDGDYLTPLGRVAVNKEIAEKLRNENDVFKYPETSHIQEHSIEVQIPFIQYHFKKPAPIVPIIIGTNDTKRIKQIATALQPWFTPDNLFIISSDFSHYPSYNDAVVADQRTAKGITSGKPDQFLAAIKENSQLSYKGMVTSMCGWTSGLTLMYLTEKDKKLGYEVIDYTNSGDSPYGGKDEVVGYNAILVMENQGKEESFSFNKEEKTQMFSIARSSIESKLGIQGKLKPVSEFLPKLSEQMGAFVTLKIDGVLRGCIGRFISEEPLSEVIRASAISSAFSDPRFPPLTKEEYSKTEFEITVLGPLKRIHDINEIILGRHGIYIRKDNHAGTMLPQVATENNWTREQFLGYTSRDKAGIGWDGWKNAEIYIYEGVVLEENGK
ncbi:MAG TPA: AmmeMemoRadiSam system protein B [Bacteroidales bacterium]|nr:AmmeMemoRadiSam system protein B [Bacteroidales bacterium]